MSLFCNNNNYCIFLNHCWDQIAAQFAMTAAAIQAQAKTFGTMYLLFLLFHLVPQLME
jgi:hypothetical protein